MNISGARYRLLRRLAVGGMAEIFLATLVGEAGFERPVILKKILPNLAGDPDFVRRLVDEGLLAARLNHPNIVQILDLGKLGPDFFIAMEYVEGPDLRDVLQRAKSRGFQIPVPIGTHLLWQVARGLAYAHEKKDNTGAPLGIVHRDVSPANVLLSWEGQVKLTDFGIAKANRRLTVTLPGILQGKFPYMSPEQGEGDDLDCRSDVFSFGTVAFELLSLQRPFEAPSDLRTLEAIRSAAPADLNSLRPALPPGLLEVVDRCLRKQREQRYASGADLERALAQLMRTEGWVVTDADVADFMQMLYGEEVSKSSVGEEVAMDTWMPSTPLQPAEMVNVQWGVTTPPVADGTRSVRVPDWRAMQRKRRWGLAGGVFLALLVLVGGLIWWAPWSRPSSDSAVASEGQALAEPAPDPDVKLDTNPAVQPAPRPIPEPAKATPVDIVGPKPLVPSPNPVDQHKMQNPPASTRGGWVRLGKTLLGDWGKALNRARLVGRQFQVSKAGSQGPLEEAKPTLTRLFVSPEGAIITVDGQLLGPGPQLVTLAPGQRREIRAEAAGYHTEQFVLEYPGPRKVQKSLQADGQGRLALRYFPANASVTIDGKAVAGHNGLNIVEMDLPTGAHVVVLRHEEREVVKTITIEKDREWRGTMTVDP